MKIGIFLYIINPDYAGGVNSYIMGLLEGFRKVDRENAYVLFVSEHNRHLFKKFEGDNFITEEIKIDSKKGLASFYKEKIKRILIDYFAILPVVRIFFSVIYNLASHRLISLIDSSPIDVLYCPHEYPIYWKKPTIVSIHDIQYFHCPEFFSFGQRWHREIFYRNTVKGATIVQASSEYIKEDFLKYFDISPKKVVVIRDGINKIFKENIMPLDLLTIKNKYNLPNNFIFYPAQHWPHKNHVKLIKAISFLKREKNLDIYLILTGEKRKETYFLCKEINNLGLEKNVRMIGNVPFKDLPYLYKLANLTVIPSIHESNSLPTMEALAIGCPVIASNIKPNIELNKNNTITILDPNDYKDIAEKIQLLWEDGELRGEKIRLGKELADEFSWEKTAEDYILIFEKIYKGNYN